MCAVSEPGYVTTQRPPYVPPDTSDTRRRTTTIIRLDGAAYVRFNFERLPAEYLAKTPEEEFSFYFLTDKPDGLIWYHEERFRNLYIAMKVIVGLLYALSVHIYIEYERYDNSFC
jgi:hypothetical protein